MFGKLSYLIYLLIFTLVPLGIVWAKYHTVLLRNKKIILSVIGISIVYQLIVDIYVHKWSAWFFSADKILGVYILNSPIEDTLFLALVSAVISSSVIAFVYHEQKHGRST